MSMLQFLKESTFRANDVITRSISILSRHYISIAGLCLLLFLVSNLSTLLSIYFDGYANLVKVGMLLLFVFLYFSLQLVLLKRAVHLVKEEPSIGLWKYLPSFWQFSQYIGGLIVYSILAGFVYLLMYVLCFPLLYLDIDMDTIRNEIHPLLTGFVMLIVVLRTIFYPFFIIEQQAGTFKAYKFSLALTRGNVFRLAIIVFAVAFTHLLMVSAEYFNYVLVAKIFSVINSFVMIPMVSIVMSVVYVDMMKSYAGSDDPSLIDNLI